MDWLRVITGVIVVTAVAVSVAFIFWCLGTTEFR